MALTATITLSQSTIGIHGVINALVAVSNSAGVPVTVQHMQPTVVSSGNAQNLDASCFTCGRAKLGPNNLIAASSTNYFSFAVVINKAQSSVIGPQPETYNVSCTILGSDGSSIAPTPATLTITPIP